MSTLETFDSELRAGAPVGDASEAFDVRKEIYADDALSALSELYGSRDDFAELVARIYRAVHLGFDQRSENLKHFDLRRSQQPDWFQQTDRIGYMCYVDRFAGTLGGVEEKIPYLKELGITYLHLLPLLKPRDGDRDGGFAVSDFHNVNPDFGTMADLSTLAEELRNNDISLCIDLICNHTSDEHKWAMAAKSGNQTYKNYYNFYPNRTLPDRYEKDLTEVFAQSAPGNFTHVEELDEWVWTTFYPYQWDLNYSNPAVFVEMLETLLFLANQGVEIFRLDSVPFLWKELGTDSQNRPEAHSIIRALRALVSMAAPSVCLKAEAIVPSNQLVRYLGRGEHAGKECHLAYNSTLMTMLWSALAEGTAKRISKVLASVPPIPENASWVSYIRCHDDIRWGVLHDETESYSQEEWEAHTQFLSDFYASRTENSFASGAKFQTTDGHEVHGTSGTMASLCGLEKALDAGNDQDIKLSVQRILLMYSIILGYGGIPLVNMGDELGMLNNRDYQNNADFDGDGRWLHRVSMNWQQADKRHQNGMVEQKVFEGLSELIQLRAGLTALKGGQAHVLATANDAVLVLHHRNAQGELYVAGNFSDKVQKFKLPNVNASLEDCRTGKAQAKSVELKPYETIWLQPKH